MECIFCRIVKGSIPCFKVLETETCLAFLDVSPLSPGHTLIVPKKHGARLGDLADEDVKDILPSSIRVAKALNVTDYNVLQNNGRLAHQEVDHVHFHLIPKRSEEEGLGIGWPKMDIRKDELAAMAADLRSRLE
jgi:diadenosine tetraphosphate (Ap4A) HIT family hydrolase